MQKVKPIYKTLLVAALALYIVGATYFLADIYYRIGAIEHVLIHMLKCTPHK